MSSNAKRGWKVGAIFGVIALLTLVGLQVYRPSHPRLTQPDREARLGSLKRDVAGSANPANTAEPRALIGAWREFVLDYPDAKETKLRLRIAILASQDKDPDTTCMADEIEHAAAIILADLGPLQNPTQKAFEAAGFESMYLSPQWTPAFVTADIDADGRKDLLLVYPSWSASVCSLFRHTAEGWKTYRLVLGPRVQGVWVTDATPSGPKVIEVASLADADYRPNLLLDAFAWQKGRVNSVLSTKIANGFQFTNKTAGDKGARVIEVYGRSKPPDYYDLGKRPDRVRQFRWDGAKFELLPSGTVSIGQPPDPPVNRPEIKMEAGSPVARNFPVREELVAELNRLESALFQQKDYEASLNSLTAFEERIRSSALTEADKTQILLEVFYHQALCHRKLGRNDHAAVMYGALLRGNPDSAWSRLSRQWIRFESGTNP